MKDSFILISHFLQFFHVDPGVQSHLFEHANQIFAAHVAHLLFGVRAPPQSAHARIKTPDPHLHCFQNVEQGQSMSVVKMKSQLVFRNCYSVN